MDVDYWSMRPDGRMLCTLCPRACALKPGQRGVCFVRQRQDDRMVLTTYGRSTGFCIDPVEKKPLNHFLPGTPTLSFGTAGCNLVCRFCQNWHISKSKATDAASDRAGPEQIAEAAARTGSRSVSFTYNDPVIFMEYAIDVAQACHARGIHTVAVTAGYIEPEPRIEFFKHMDAANVDLKGFTERFYHRLAGGHLQPILDTLRYIKHETDVWLELTTLLIPGENDSPREVEVLTRWVAEQLGPDTPIHFTAFHPDWKLRDKPRTSAQTLARARHIAEQNGLRYAFTGNVLDRDGGSTYCHACNSRLIERNGWDISHWNLDAEGNCNQCGSRCAGVFEAGHGTWGARRQPIHIG